MINLNIISNQKIVSRITTVILLISTFFLFTECKRTSKGEDSLTGGVAASSNFFVSNGPYGYVTPLRKSTGVPVSTPTGSPKGSAFNLTKDSIYFVAKFSENVSWNLTLKGLNSGAIKILNGISDSLNVRNTLWIGDATGIPFFERNEKVVATLSVLGSTQTYSDTISILSPNSYVNLTNANGVQYLILDDFESSGIGASFPLTAISVDPLDLNYCTYNIASDKRVSGMNSFYMKGFDSNWNNYLIAKGNLAPFTTPFPITETDPTKVYFNLYVYGTGAANASIQFAVYECEHLPLQYNPLADDAWLFNLMINWTGWKLVSIPYSAMQKFPDPTSGGNGNGVKEPNLASGTSLTLQSYPTPGKTVDAYIDMFSISVGGPFVP